MSGRLTTGDQQIARASTTALITVLAWAAAVFLLIGTIATLVALQYPEGGPRPGILTQLVRLFSANGEGNAVSWLSATSLALLGLAFLAVSCVTLDRGAQRTLRVFALVAVAMSLDEAAQIHEYLSLVATRLGVGSTLTWNWLLLGVPFAFAIGIALVWCARRISRWLRRRLVVAGSIYLFGAVVIEAIGGFERRVTYVDDPFIADVINTLLVAAEESLELAGIMLALAATLSVMVIDRTDVGVTITANEERLLPAAPGPEARL